MRFWNEWTDEHWDVVATALAVTTAVAFACSLLLAFSVLVAPVDGRGWSAGGEAVPVDDGRASIHDRDTP